MAESEIKRQGHGGAGNIDAQEAAHFAALADDWHNPAGAHAALHKLNPVRLGWLKSLFAQHFGKDPHRLRPLEGLKLADIGCGGGLLTAPLARLGADMVGVDITSGSIAAARAYAKAQDLAIRFETGTAEDLLAQGEQFDGVLAMELLEHVPHPDQLLATCAGLTKAGGLVAAATLNRTPEAWLFAILGGEYILGQIPVGTHDYAKFIRPDEMKNWFIEAGLEPKAQAGAMYDILSGRFHLSDIMRVNYMMAASKSSAAQS